MKTLKKILLDNDWTSTDLAIEAVREWLHQKQQPVEGMRMRNNVKGLLFLQGKQQMLQELLSELE